MHLFPNFSAVFFCNFNGVELIDLRDPWSYKNLYGWIGEYTFQMISGDLYLIISMLFASFFISVCLHHRAFSEQFQALLHQLNVRNDELVAGMMAQGHDERNQQQYNHRQRQKIRIFLHRIVQFHILTTE